MSIIPELIIQRALVNGIRNIRGSAWRSDQLFKNVPQTYARDFFNLVKNTPIDVTMNYPREDSQFPCVCILLRAEEETDIFLGDFMSSGYDDKGSLLGTNEFFFTEDATQSTSTSFGTINAVGEPPKLFDRKDRLYKEVKGSGFSCSYLLQVMTDDQDFTVFLYHLVRYIVLSNISMFTANGIHQLRLSGTDFLPQASQQPSFIFMRGINMNFLYFADHFAIEGDEGVEAIAKAFVIDMGLASKKDFGLLTSVQKPRIESVAPITAAQGTTVEWTYNANGTVNQTGFALKGINFQADLGNYDYLTITDINMSGNYLTISSNTKVTHVHLAGENISGGGGTSALAKTLKPGDDLIYVNDATVFAQFQTLGTLEFFVSVGNGLSIDFVKSGEEISGTAGYIRVDNISVGMPSSTYERTEAALIEDYSQWEQDEIVFTALEGGTLLSTDVKYNYSTDISSGISQGMFLQVIGPTTHPCYNEQRRILTVSATDGTTITVANKFSGSLVGAIVRVLKRSNTITFDATIASNTPTGTWDIVVTNPDLITATLKNSFTIT